MTISERMFQIMGEKGITQAELSGRTGIARQTISDWKHKNTNPGADKIMVICEALEVSPTEFLTGYAGEPSQRGSEMAAAVKVEDLSESYLIENYRELSESQKRRLLAYMAMLQNRKR